MHIEFDEDGVAAMLVHVLARPDVQAALRTAMQAQPPAAPLQLYMTAKDFASHLGVSLRTVRTWLASGLPTVGRKRLRKVDVARAMAWLQAGGDDGAVERQARHDARCAAVRRVG